MSITKAKHNGIIFKATQILILSQLNCKTVKNLTEGAQDSQQERLSMLMLSFTSEATAAIFCALSGSQEKVQVLVYGIDAKIQSGNSFETKV